MKHLTEYRDADLVRRVLEDVARANDDPLGLQVQDGLGQVIGEERLPAGSGGGSEGKEGRPCQPEGFEEATMRRAFHGAAGPWEGPARGRAPPGAVVGVERSARTMGEASRRERYFLVE